MPQREAGMRMEPAVSLPSEPKQRPAARAAPEPPLEPPVMRPRSQGLWQGGEELLTLVPPQAPPRALRRVAPPRSASGSEAGSRPSSAASGARQPYAPTLVGAGGSRDGRVSGALGQGDLLHAGDEALGGGGQ